MAKKSQESDLQNLPACTAEFIKLVIKKMRYRKKIRADVMAELAAHFEDELRDCKSDDEKQQTAQRLIDDFGDVKLLGVLLRRAKKRCRPLWRTIVARSFQTIGILFLCLILYCVYLSAGKPNININYAEKATDIVRPKADESLNAAVLYQKAIDVYKEPPHLIQAELDGASNDNCGQSDKSTNEETALLKQWREIIRTNWIGDLTEEEIGLLESWISENTEAIEFFIEGSEKPYCWWDRIDANNPPLVEILLPEIGPMKAILIAVCWQAKLKAYAGDTEGAFDDLLSCYKAGNHLKGPRTLIEQLVGIGIQALAIGNTRTILSNIEVGSQTLKHLQEKLYKLSNETIYVTDIEAEKFCTLDFIQRCYTDNGRGSGHLIPNALRRIGYVFQENPSEEAILNFAPFLGLALVSADRKQITQMTEKFYDNMQRLAYKTPWQIKQENVDFTMGLDKWSKFKQARYFLISILAPSCKKVHQISYRLPTDVNATLTVIAMLRYAQNKGDYPENLEQLITSGYLKELPIDPWSDEPLVYRKTDEGFSLYSVGLNFTDDGGEVFRNNKGKVRRWAEEGDAVFWPVQN